MPTVTYYPIGNADCILVDLASGKKILFDYAHTRDPDSDDDPRCDLPRELREDPDAAERGFYDVVAFTHLDWDHYAGATDFFYFEHIAKYQDDVESGPRIKMNTMWVPAAIITEKLGKDADTEAKAIQKEARERFKAKSGIRVFSRPARLKKWCEENGIDFKGREHLVTDAGKRAPEFTVKKDGVEFFVHSPFAVRQDEHTVEDRNNDSLVMHATFVVDGEQTRLFLTSDVDHAVITDIVKVTEGRKRLERLGWDIFKLAHHCSHHALSDQERGGDKSEPVPCVKRLFETYGQDRCIIVSTSDPIPERGDERDKKGSNPPHRQAANYYKENVACPNMAALDSLKPNGGVVRCVF
ncbi:MAG: hypothetical protein GY842_02750 [bacterium]|nr:hypothetical protein [bacterium]